jgi:hypothetical protein
MKTVNTRRIGHYFFGGGLYHTSQARAPLRQEPDFETTNIAQRNPKRRPYPKTLRTAKDS